jgi:hypothetical protein
MVRNDGVLKTNCIRQAMGDLLIVNLPLILSQEGGSNLGNSTKIERTRDLPPSEIKPPPHSPTMSKAEKRKIEKLQTKMRELSRLQHNKRCMDCTEKGTPFFFFSLQSNSFYPNPPPCLKLKIKSTNLH